MADVEDSLEVVISADASRVAAAYEEVVSHGERLAASVLGAGAAGETAGRQITEGARSGAAAMRETSEAGAHMGHEINEGAREGLYALRQLGETAKGLREGLLALAGPVAAIFAISEAFQDAVKEASDAESSLGQLTNAVKAQGLAADESREKVEKYSTELAERSQFAADQFNEGVRQMVTSGLSLNTALASQAAAMELATAKGIPLASAEQILTDAHQGRTRSLIALGLATKDEVQNGIAYQDILDRITARLGGSAAASLNTYAGASQHATNELHELLQAIGTTFLPIITDAEREIGSLAQAFRAVVEGTSPITPALQRIGQGFSTVYEAFARVVESGPGVTILFAGLTVAASRFAIVAGVDVVQSLVALGASMIGPFAAAAATVTTAITATIIPALTDMSLAFGVYGIDAIGSFVVSTATAVASLGTMSAAFISEGIPAILAWGSALITSAVAGITTFATELIATGAAALAAFGATMLRTATVSIVGFATTIFTEALPAIAALARSIFTEAIPAMLALAASMIEFVGPVLIVGGAIAALATAFATNFGHIQEIANGVVDGIVHSFGFLVEQIGKAIDVLGRAASASGQKGLADNLRGASTAMENFGKSAQGAKTDLGALLKTGEQMVTDFLHPKFAVNYKGPGKLESPAGPVTDQIGGGGGANDTIFTSNVPDKQFGDDATTQRQKAAVAAIALLSQQEAEFKIRLADATTEVEQNSRQTDLNTKIAGDAAKAVAILSSVRGQEQQQLDTLLPKYNAQTAAYKSAFTAYKAYSDSLDGKTITSDQKRHLDELKASSDKLEATYKSTQHTVEELRGYIAANSAALATAKEKTDALTAAQSELALSYDKAVNAANDSADVAKATYLQSLEAQAAFYQARFDRAVGSSAKEVAQRTAAYQELKKIDIDEFKQRADITKAAADSITDEGLYAAQLADQADTYEKITTNQRAFLQNQLDMLIASGQRYSDQAQTIGKQLIGLDEQDNKARADAHAEFLKTFDDQESKVIDDIIGHHERLRDDVLGIFDNLGESFIKMIRRMILEAPAIRAVSGAFQDAFGSLFGVQAPTPGPGASTSGVTSALTSTVISRFAGATTQGASVSLDAGSIFALTGSSNGVSGVTGGVTGFGSSAGSSDALYLATAGGLATAGISGGYAGTAAATAAANGGTAAAGGAFNPLGGIAAFGAKLGTKIPGLGGATLGSLLLGAGGGYLGGSIIGNLLNNGQNNAAAGGALGGAAAVAFGLNPLAGIGLTVGASVLGGLIGSHDKPNQMPDKYNTTQYGTILADLMGKASTNGQDFSIESSISSITGGKGGIEFAESLLSGGKPSWMTQEDYDKYAATFGTQLGGTLNNLTGKNQSQQGISGSNATAGQQSYLAIGSLLDDLITKYSAAQDAGKLDDQKTPTFSLNRTYGDYSASIIRDETGANIQINGPSGASTMQRLSPGSVTVPGSSGYAPITVSMPGATIVGPGGLNEVANQIGVAMRYAQSGIMPGSYSASSGSRAGDANP